MRSQDPCAFLSWGDELQHVHKAPEHSLNFASSLAGAHLLVLDFAQSGPDDGQQQHPQAVRQAVINVRHLAQCCQ